MLMLTHTLRSKAFIHPINLCPCYLLFYYSFGGLLLSLTIPLFRNGVFALLTLIIKSCSEHDEHLH